MTRKHFEQLANAMLHTKPNPAYRDMVFQWIRCCEAVADVLATANVRFDRDRFLRACGVPV